MGTVEPLGSRAVGAGAPEQASGQLRSRQAFAEVCVDVAVLGFDRQRLFDDQLVVGIRETEVEVLDQEGDDEKGLLPSKRSPL